MEKFPKARRPHSKTRLGCFSCKKRRIRCDQARPECRNCISREFDCEFPFLNSKSKEDEKPLSLRVLPSTRELDEGEGSDSTVTGLALPPAHPSPYNLEPADLQFVQHFVGHTAALQESGGNKTYAWGTSMSAIINLSLSHPMAKDGMMAFAASHIGWFTKSDDLHKTAAMYQASAYRRLRKAIGSFSQESADAVFAATAILTRQATEWKSWSTLHQGMKAVMESMRPYAATSRFSTILLFNLRELDACTTFNPPSPHDIQRLDLCIMHLRFASSFIHRATPLHIQLYNLLLTFALRVQSSPLNSPMTRTNNMKSCSRSEVGSS